MDDDRFKDDAWHKKHELLKEFTKHWIPREDIEVIAHATDRSVELILWEEREGLKLRGYKTTGKRNVATLKELALCLLAACDFVEEVNPEWSGDGIEFCSDVSEFERTDD